MLNNSKSQVPIEKVELSLVRVLKYRTDVHSAEKIMKKKLVTNRVEGVEAKYKD
mgnify:CR=1 FL=1